jgi:uncharacterized protein YukE
LGPETYRGPSVAEFEAVVEQMERLTIILNEILETLRRLTNAVERLEPKG